MKASMPELKGGDVDDDLMEDSDELPSGLNDDSEDGSGVELADDEDDEDEDMAGAARADDDDAFILDLHFAFLGGHHQVCRHARMDIC